MNDETRLVEDDDASGYLISVSDMMAALLFVFLITLATFVINFRIATNEQLEAKDQAEAQREKALIEKQRAEDERDAAQVEKQRLETVRDDLTNARRLRQQMLDDIRRRLKAHGIRVEIDREVGVLRLTEKAISFESGRSELSDEERLKLKTIATVLSTVLPCYAASAPADCDDTTGGKLEAVFVEGHTDNVPLQGRQDNWDLSADRAMYTYRELIAYQPDLAQLANLLDQPLFSVSGYGAGRPVIRHEAPTPEPRNRRIDLRFIMAPPPETQEPAPIEQLKQRGIQ